MYKRQLERVADILYRVSKDVERKINKKLEFNEVHLKNISKMFELVDIAMETMVNNLNKDNAEVRIDGAMDKERDIDALRKKLNKKHLKGIESADYDIHVGIIYRDIINACEKIGDHIINVTEAIVGNVATDDDDLTEQAESA